MTVSTESTQSIARPLWEGPRVQLLDDVWLMTIGAILFATALPWAVSGFEVELGKATWGLLALGAVHMAFTLPAAQVQDGTRWRGRLLTLLDGVGVMLMAYIWQCVGALQNPLFLMVFTLPVCGSIFLSRWHPYLIAVLSILCVATVALGQAPELRWYASGLLGGEAWPAWLIGTHAAAAQPSFTGLYAPLNYLKVLLEVFSILLLACAVAAEYVGTVFERLSAGIVAARTDARRGEQMWGELIAQLPAPALLVDPYNLRITACSESATGFLESADKPLEGRALFEVLKLSYPDVVNDLIVGAGGTAPWTVIRIADQLRFTQVRVSHVAPKDRRLALLTIEDATESFLLRSALDASEYAALVIDARGTVLAFNRLARGVFAEIKVGAPASSLMTQPEAALRWWEPGLTGRRKLHVEIGPRIFQITCTAVPLAGEEERLYTVALLPVANAGSNDPYASAATMLTNTLGRLR